MPDKQLRRSQKLFGEGRFGHEATAFKCPKEQ